MYVEKNKIFIGPDEGVRLTVLDMIHKVTAERFDGALTVIEWGLSAGALSAGAIIPRIPTPASTSAAPCWRVS